MTDGQAAQTIPSSLASHTADCPITAALFVYDEATSAYVTYASHPDANLIPAFVTATGIVTVVSDSTDALGGGAIVGSRATFISFTLPFRVIYTSTYSTVIGGVAQDDYDVTFVNACYDNSFTLANPSA